MLNDAFIYFIRYTANTRCDCDGRGNDRGDCCTAVDQQLRCDVTYCNH